MITNNFTPRHNGVSKAADEEKMLKTIGVSSMEELIDKAVPKAIRLDKPMPIDVSNVQLVCPKCEKATRIGHAFGEDGKKYRVCKKCGHQF